jgi:hypothetical protein
MPDGRNLLMHSVENLAHRVSMSRMRRVFLGHGRIAGRRLLCPNVTQTIRSPAEATASLVDLLCLRDPDKPIARLGPTSAWANIAMDQCQSKLSRGERRIASGLRFGPHCGPSSVLKNKLDQPDLWKIGQVLAALQGHLRTLTHNRAEPRFVPLKGGPPAPAPGLGLGRV